MTKIENYINIIFKEAKKRNLLNLAPIIMVSNTFLGMSRHAEKDFPGLKFRDNNHDECCRHGYHPQHRCCGGANIEDDTVEVYIYLDNIKNESELITTLVHEFRHVAQYRAIVATWDVETYKRASKHEKTFKYPQGPMEKDAFRAEKHPYVNIEEFISEVRLSMGL